MLICACLIATALGMAPWGVLAYEFSSNPIGCAHYANDHDDVLL